MRLSLTCLLVWALMYEWRDGNEYVRPVLYVAFAGWLFWAVGERRFPRAGRTALAAAALLPATLTGIETNGANLIFLYAPLFTFVLLPRMPLWAILTLGGLIITVQLTALGVAGRGPTAMLTQPVLVIILLLFNLHRREHRLRAEQTEELLEQTRRAQEAQTRAAALDERSRIAREIHDVLAHSLGALGVQLEVAEAQLTERNDTEAAAERIRRARRLAADGLTEARSAVAALREDVPPLPRALDDLATVHRANHATEVTLRTDGTVRGLASGAEVSLLRTAREALTNAARHAPGEPVTITLEYGPRVRLMVSNPVVSEEQGAGGYGLTGARERIALADGTLEAGVTDGVWRVTAEVPG